MTPCVIPTIPLSERRAYTMGEAAALVRLSVSTLYAERTRGRLETIKLAGRRLITREALDAYIAKASGHVAQSDQGVLMSGAGHRRTRAPARSGEP